MAARRSDQRPADGIQSPIESPLIATAARMLRASGQRLTVGRVGLVELLAGAERPLTIPEVLERDRSLAQSSAYRNLTVLEHAGVVRRIVTHDEFARYELAEDLTGHHHHLVCRACGRVEDLPASPGLERSVGAAIDDAVQQSGFRVDHHRLDLVGTCAECA
ncbi:MAG TPA: Fur family transcriptional regulator [Acidimicrobiia bacterium]|nr:Fur family transcriptional regulator [Acidimicrobiia bacterium]